MQEQNKRFKQAIIFRNHKIEALEEGCPSPLHETSAPQLRDTSQGCERKYTSLEAECAQTLFNLTKCERETVQVRQQVSDRDEKLQAMEKHAADAGEDYDLKLSKLEHAFEAASIRGQSAHT